MHEQGPEAVDMLVEVCDALPLVVVELRVEVDTVVVAFPYN